MFFEVLQFVVHSLNVVVVGVPVVDVEVDVLVEVEVDVLVDVEVDVVVVVVIHSSLSQSPPLVAAQFISAASQSHVTPVESPTPWLGQ